MRKYLFISFVISFLSLQNCVTTQLPGLLFTNTNQFAKGDAVGNLVTSAKIEKSGKSCAMSSIFLTLFFYGSGNSIEEAAQNAGIKKIAVVDRESLTILPAGLFYRDCVIVWGE